MEFKKRSNKKAYSEIAAEGGKTQLQKVIQIGQPFEQATPLFSVHFSNSESLLRAFRLSCSWPIGSAH